MKIAIAPDSFKECLTASQVADAIELGVKSVNLQAETVCVPMTDGGDGALRVLVDGTGGKLVEIQVHDPLMRPTVAHYGVLGDNQTAVIEMAQASGLVLLGKEERNPLFTTSYGVGELMKSAILAGYSKLLVCIGGSATNDGGAGMLQALGCKLLDRQDNEIAVGNEPLAQLASIHTQAMDKLLKGCTIQVASDVANPLCGDEGASAIFSLQKGAKPEAIPTLDANLQHFARLSFNLLGVDYSCVKGAGAAGGLGFALMAFCNAEMESGVQLATKLLMLEQAIRGADLVITAEGSVDSQTAYGKVPVGVARIAKRMGIPTVVLCGKRSGMLDQLYKNGVSGVFAIADSPMSIEQSMVDASRLLAQQAGELVRLLAGKL